MAMNALREAAKESKFMKFILGGFIFLAVGGLVFTDINGYFRGGLPNTTVARVGDVEISIAEFDNGLRGFLQQAQITAEDAYDAGLVNAYLQSRIDTILEAQATDDLNIRVSNKVIAGEIKKVFANASRDEIESSLRARGMSEAQMASILRDQIRTEMVTRLPMGVSTFTPAFISVAVQRANNEQRSGVLYTFPATKLSDAIVISDDEVQAYYNENKDNYAIPAEHVFTIGTLSLGDVESTLAKPSDADIRADYESRMDDFETAETRTIEQIVATDPDQAQQIYELSADGMNLKDAAVKAGADVKTYRPAADYQANGLPDELSSLAFANNASVGDVLPPAKTLIGWHVMKINAIKPSTVTLFDDVKAEIAKTLAEQGKYDALYDRIIRTEEMVDRGDDFQKIASETGLKTTTTKSVTQSEIDQLPQTLQDVIAQNPTVAEEIFALSEGMASYPVETDDGGYIVIGAKTVTPQSYKPLEDVSADIKALLKDEQVASNASARLDDIVNDLHDGTLSTAEMAQQYGAQSNVFKNIGLTSTKYNADLIFDTDYEGFNAAINDDNQVQIANVTDVNRVDSNDSKPNNEWAQKYTNMFNAVENGYYRANTDISVNDELLAAQYGGE